MSYTPTTWTTGDTITASAMNKIEQGIAGASPWDAVIRLTHANNSNADSTANLTPSIISGSYADLYSKLNNGGYPCIHIQYYHPWGMYGSLEGVIIYFSENYISIKAAGYFPLDNTFKSLGLIVWENNDTIGWD